jgi:hypothetical protein
LNLRRAKAQRQQTKQLSATEYSVRIATKQHP